MKNLIKILFCVALYPTFTLAIPVDSYLENFDSISVPSLPSGWSTTAPLAANRWKTVSDFFYSAPSSAFAPNPAVVSDSVLNAKEYLVNSVTSSYGIRLSFAHRFEMEQRSTTEAFDGGVVEVSFNGGAFTDVTSAGGVFIENGYNRRINSLLNPLHNRNCFSGVQTAFFQVSEIEFANIPQSVTSIKFRWRLGTDEIVAKPGWWIDYVYIKPLVNTALSSSIVGPNRLLYTSQSLVSTSITNLSPFELGSASLLVQSYGADLGDFNYGQGALYKFATNTASLDLRPAFGVPALMRQGESTNISFSINTNVPRKGSGLVTFNPSTPNEYVAPVFYSDIGSISDDQTIEALTYVVGNPCAPFPPAPPTAGKIAFFFEPILPCTIEAAANNMQSAGFVAGIMQISTLIPVTTYSPIPGINMPIFIFSPILETYSTVYPLDPSAPLRIRFGRNISSVFTTAGTSFDDPDQKNNYVINQLLILLDSDSDGTFDVDDQCPASVIKTAPGVCGCSVADVDANSNGAIDCQASLEIKAQLNALNKLVRSLKAPTDAKSKAKFTKTRSKINKAHTLLRNFGKSQSALISVASGQSLDKLLNGIKKQNTALKNASSSGSINTVKSGFLSAIKKMKKGIL